MRFYSFMDHCLVTTTIKSFSGRCSKNPFEADEEENPIKQQQFMDGPDRMWKLGKGGIEEKHSSCK